MSSRLMRLFLLLSVLLCQTAFGSFNWNDYSDLLRDSVAPGEKQGIRTHLVNYTQIANDPRYLKTLEAIATYNPTALASSEKKAFYINLYNLMAIKMVIDHMPLKSIRDAGSWFSPVWQKPVGVLNGKTITLDQIEHKILRKMNDPRIHFAIVCASLSCPDLLAEAYNKDALNEQLEQQARNFLTNPTKGLRIKGNKVYLSKIFDWFEEDFAKEESEEAILKYVATYNLEAGRFSDYRAIDYNWQLNKQ